jgi:gamma-glutamyl-gamma-aminobutyrate hydrolase PuuD
VGEAAAAKAAPAAPLVGVTTYAEVADWADWPQPVVLTPQNYVSCLVKAGANPVLLPPAVADAEAVGRTLDRLDGLVLIGGDDICGRVLGAHEDEEEHNRQRHNPARDAFELVAARLAWARDMPTLAICRGIQVLNVALGGTLIGDLFEAGYSREHRVKRGIFNRHPVEFEPRSAMSELYGRTTDVLSHHHQAIDRLAEGLVVTGRAEDGVVEAVEAPDRRFVVGVQWHPEEGDDLALFRAFVREATR